MLLAATALAQDWPHARGPAYTGSAAPEFRLPTDPKPTVIWRADIGEGFSGCVLANGRLYTQGQTAAGQFVICLDSKTGAELWRRRIEWAWEPGGRYPGPFATPTFCEGRVYYAGAYGSVGCLDARTGRQAWSVDLVVDHGVERPGFGYACTPLCRSGAVFVYGGERGPSLLAFDARTGRLLWRAGADASAYNSPIPVCVEGSEQIVLFHQNAIAGYDPASGRPLWRQPWSRGYDPHPAWMLFDEPFLFCAAPFRRGSAVYRLTTAVDGPGSDEAWRSRAMSQDILSGVLSEGYVYGFDLASAQAETTLQTRGRLACMELATGRVLWSTPGVGHASVIAADGWLLILTEIGQLALAAASPEAYREVARLDVLSSERCWTAPAAADGRVYIRGERTIAAVDFGGVAIPASMPVSAITAARPVHTPLAALVEPSMADLLRWGVAGFAIVTLGAVVRAALTAGHGIVAGWAFLLLSAGLSVLLPRVWPTPLFTWPVVLYAGLIAALDARTAPRSALVARLALLLFAALCLVCWWDCRRRSIAVAPAFLVGFGAALPLVLPAAASRTAGRRRGASVARVSCGFVAYYTACAAFLLWRNAAM